MQQILNDRMADLLSFYFRILARLISGWPCLLVQGLQNLLVMKYPTDSALQNHYLDSFLPHPVYPETRHFLKNREFYQPQQFIWNNPHRTSDQMYKFYHAVNDKFRLQKQPLLIRQQEKEKESKDMARIQHVIAFRSEARQKFLGTQQRRQQLEDSLRKGSVVSRLSAVDQPTIAPSPQLGHPSPARGNYTHGLAQKHQIVDPTPVRQSYDRGVQMQDSKSSDVLQLISNQKEQFRDKVRSSFMFRKRSNLSVNSKSQQGPNPKRESPFLRRY